MIHVCSLSRLNETVEDTGARHVVSLLGDEARLERPAGIAPENHLWLKLHDISSPLDGYIMPGEEHVADLINFVRGWDRRAPLVVHCFAGISRSTASAYAAVCALTPDRDEYTVIFEWPLACAPIGHAILKGKFERTFGAGAAAAAEGDADE